MDTITYMDRLAVEHQRVHEAERDARLSAATEIARRLTDLNHAHERAGEVAHTYLTIDKYEANQQAETTARDLALERRDDQLLNHTQRLTQLEKRLDRFVGMAAVATPVLLIAGGILGRLLG